tara:strand:- start:4768 stop:5514 length:747 start_codon:yes stop_codon:yes gene_type:complete
VECPTGEYSPEGQTSCGACPAGKSSTVGQAVCYTQIPNAVEGGRSLGIWQAVDTYETPATIDKYGQIEYWDTSLVTSMASLFSGSQFNGDISKWNTGAVLDMGGMFFYSLFNGDISKWNTGAVTNMIDLFTGATAFNSDISKWDVSKVTDMLDMFKDSGFKRPLCGGRWGYLAKEWIGEEGGAFYRCCDGESCRMCEAGEYASAGSCTACPSGKFSRPESLDSSACFALSSVLSKTQLKAAYSTYSTC